MLFLAILWNVIAKLIWNFLSEIVDWINRIMLNYYKIIV